MKGQLLTEGNMLGNLLRFSLPFFAANVLQALYGAADLVIVGQFCDAAGVSAVAIGSQVMQTVTGLCIGLATGATVAAGQQFGAGNKKGVSHVAGAVAALFGVIALTMTLGLYCFAPEICAWMHTPEAAEKAAEQYLRICSMGTVFILGYNAVAGILRGLGDSRTPLAFVAAACVINVGLDLLLVGTFQMGAAGAALATTASQGLSLGMAVLFLGAKGLLKTFRRYGPRVQSCSIKQILILGAPIAAQDGLVNVSFLIITAIVNTMGLAASAALGVVEKLIIFCMLPTTAFASAVAAVTAQHQGAGLIKRARTCLYEAIGLSLIPGIAFFVFAQLRGADLLRLFTNEQEVILAGVAYLRSYSLDCVVVCFVFCMNAYFSGMGRSGFPLVHSLLSTFFIRIPFSYFASILPEANLFFVGWAAPAASTVSLLFCCVYLYSLKRRERGGVFIRREWSGGRKDSSPA